MDAKQWGTFGVSNSTTHLVTYPVSISTYYFGWATDGGTGRYPFGVTSGGTTQLKLYKARTDTSGRWGVIAKKN